MFRLAVVAAFLVLVNGSVLPDEPMLDERIVGGSPAIMTEAPYQVALLLDSFNTGSYVQLCGGSIVGKSVIVTTARCVNRTRPPQWRARAGANQHSMGGQLIDVSSFLLHPGFNTRLNNDIALVFLDFEFVLGPTVKLAIIPYQGENVAPGTNALITGWGTLSNGSSPPGLHKATVPIVDDYVCHTVYQSFNPNYPVTEKMICAGFMESGGVDTCTGDSGGPLAIEGKLIGITSWRKGCGEPGYPGVYTRVSAFSNWIEANK